MGKTFRRDSDYGRKFERNRRSNKKNSNKFRHNNHIDSTAREGYVDPYEQ